MREQIITSLNFQSIIWKIKPKQAVLDVMFTNSENRIVKLNVHFTLILFKKQEPTSEHE